MKIADQWLRDVLGLLYQRRTSTRAEIADATGLNPACVSQTLRRLLESGTLQSVGELRSTGGRKREVLKLNSEAGYFVVVDLEGSRIRFALTNFLGDIRYRWEENLVVAEPFDIGRIASGIRMLFRHLSPAERSRVVSVGVSYSGTMSPDGRITSYNLGWEELPLRERLEEAIGLPLFLGSDGFCKTLAERWLGVASNCDHFVYILAGIGIGVGIFVNGRYIDGAGGMAGEFGHVTVDPAAQDLCACGKHGCLEAIVSSPNIVRQYLERRGSQPGALEGYQIGEVFARARAGDRAALDVMDRVARYLGLGLSHLVNILNPGLIVLGGDLTGGYDLLAPVLNEELRRHSVAKLVKGLAVRASALGHDSGLKGAAALAFRESLMNPDLLRRMSGPMILEMDNPEASIAVPGDA